MCSAEPSRAHWSTTWCFGSAARSAARSAAGSTPPAAPTPVSTAGAGASLVPLARRASALSRALRMPWHATTARGDAAASALSASAIAVAEARAPEDASQDAVEM